MGQYKQRQVGLLSNPILGNHELKPTSGPRCTWDDLFRAISFSATFRAFVFLGFLRASSPRWSPK
jgi:hypothetical protein